MRRRPTPWRTGMRRTALLVAGTALPLGWLSAAPAHAVMPMAPSASPQTVTVGDSIEAWYAAAPIDVCTSPLGCPPSQVPTSPYPADTLHVGVAGGQETARTYLMPDLSSLPVGGTATSGTMTLPVATGSADGTNMPQSAKIQVCLATKPVTDGAQGSTSAAPSIDCKISTTAVYDAAKSSFTVVLAPFLTAWSSGSPPFGLALVPDLKAVQPTDAWHVAFNGRKRAASPHISSALTVTVTSPDGLGAAAPPAPTAPSAPGAGAQPAAPGVALPSGPAAAVPGAAPPVVAGTPQQPAPVVAQPVALSRPFQYPLAFLVPLALLAGAVFFARLFTRDATPLRTRT